MLLVMIDGSVISDFHHLQFQVFVYHLLPLIKNNTTSQLDVVRTPTLQVPHVHVEPPFFSDAGMMEPEVT